MSSPTSTSVVTIRTVRVQDIDTVKHLILQMLTDSPEAFGETLSEAQARTDRDWEEFIQSMITPPGGAAFFAYDQQGACGYIAGDATNPQTPPGTVMVSRLWVAPRQRGTGLGRQLMDAVTKWAGEQNSQLIGLGVTEMNLNAMKFYEHLGYFDTGIRFPLPWDQTKQILILGRKL